MCDFKDINKVRTVINIHYHFVVRIRINLIIIISQTEAEFKAVHIGELITDQ